MAATLIASLPSVADLPIADEWPAGDTTTGEWENMPPATEIGAATLGGTAAISASGFRIHGAISALAAAATVTATGNADYRADATTLSGTANFTAVGLVSGRSDMTSSATVTASGAVDAEGAAALGGTATAAADGWRYRAGTAEIAATATVAAAGVRSVAAAAALAATADLHAQGPLGNVDWHAAGGHISRRWGRVTV